MDYSEGVWLGVFMFLGGFLCTQFMSHLLTLDSFITFLLSAWMILFPNSWLSSFVPSAPVDPLHEYLLMLVMLVNLVPALVWFLSTDFGDVSIRTALAITRLLEYGSTAFLTFWEQRSSEMFNPTKYRLTFYSLATLAAAYAVHLFLDSSVNAYSRSGNLNAYLYADLLLSFVCACLCVFVPRFLGLFFGQSLDDLHVFLYQTYGLMTIGLTCLPWLAPRFRSVSNKRSVLFSRATTMLGTLLLTFYKYKQGDIPDVVDSKGLMACLLLLTLPSAIGCMRLDQGSNWDMPWRGLRVPDVNTAAGSPREFLSKSKQKTKRRKPISRGRAKSRGRSRRRR